ncbi:transketolase [Patescibacteria group bacterium]|nr:transketolase [Patescibacteria group bacterium]
MNLPEFGETLGAEHVKFLEAFSKSCRSSIVQMVTNAQSGHPGGSLSCLDYLSLIYTMRVCKTNESVVVSNGHISPAVYSVLAEIGVIPKETVIEKFRKPDDIYEGHVNRKIPGVHYGTGPLGVGGSVSSAFALAEKLKGKNALVFLIMGDGEQQEGQAYEMMNFASKYNLGNLILFVDYNKVQLTDALDSVMPTNIAGHYRAAGWHVIETDGHNFESMWQALSEAFAIKDKPTCILGETVMGYGVEFMEAEGRILKPDWHGMAPKKERAEEGLELIKLNPEEEEILKNGLAALPNEIETLGEPELDAECPIDQGEPITYSAEDKTDCRSAYGKALLDLAQRNENILAMTADLAGSVKTDGVKENFPERHIECGIAEQHMVSAAGGFSLRGFIPFASTFGAFMSSRAKDQARVNDINETNVKMVATHCGLSVGEDGPTHQAIDDINSFEGFMHTHILEPADPNQCDRIIRFVASHYNNFYVRMGRSKVSVICKEDGTPFFAGDYEFKLGKADILRSGTKATIIAAGPMVERALKVADELSDIEVICVSSFAPFDNETIVESVKKTGHVVTVHDHALKTGLGSFVKAALAEAQVQASIKELGVSKYALSGTSDELYERAGLAGKDILAAVKAGS